MTEDESTIDTSEPEEEDQTQEHMSNEVWPRPRLKRKRSQDEAVPSQLQISQHWNNIGAEVPAEKISYLASCMFPSDLDSVLTGSLSVFLSKLKPESPKYHGNDREFMLVAQSVVEQLTLGTDSLPEIARSLDIPYCQPSGGEIKTIEDPLQPIIEHLFPRTQNWNLHQLATIGIEPPDGMDKDSVLSRPSLKESVLMPKPPHSPKRPTGSFCLPTPYTRVRRNQKPIDILGSALHFWEELGLEPAHGAKNILALYIYPAIYSIREGLEAFAAMIGSSYQNCKLGNHVSISNLVGYPKGLVPVLSGNCSVPETAAQLNSLCEKLGKDPYDD